MTSKTSQIQYHLDESGAFVIENYQNAKLFASFLPGLAGKTGIPMWLFYVNRGQCVCSMGIEGKHNPIMEFLPANWAYNLVSTQGFRTFLKFTDGTEPTFYEPFQNHLHVPQMELNQRMIITPEALRIEEENHSLGLRFTVDYFNVPQDRYAGLIRKLQIVNTGNSARELEVLDGLPLIIPYGIDNYGLKNIRRLVEAFVEVINTENRAPFFKGKVEPADRPDVVHIKKGNFYLGYIETEHGRELVQPVVDPVRIFGIRGDYQLPEMFLKKPVNELYEDQILENRLPCAMGTMRTTIGSQQDFTYTSVIGHAASVERLQELIPEITRGDYADVKQKENKEVVDRLTQHNFIHGASPVLNRYARQNFLDNALRGGFPYTVKGRGASAVLHLYSRKHGDLERDYNDFRLTPTPWSQGNGNFRDVNQNRRCDLFFNPDVMDGNVEHFYNLIQLDGFNPLVIREVRFVATDGIEGFLKEYFEEEHARSILEFVRTPFTPGELLLQLEEQEIPAPKCVEEFLGDLLGRCRKQHETDYGEGYWTDHWTYNLDLIENYLAVFPEKKKSLLFEKKTFTYYENSHHVAPRADKYVVWDGNPMQLNAVVFDEDHQERLDRRIANKNLIHTKSGAGEVYTTTLIQKMICLAVNKLASLDPAGVGIEMESDKPNWYDALNGLPGQIGSSLNETLELKRHLLFLKDALLLVPEDWTIDLFTELHAFFSGLSLLLIKHLPEFEYWDKSATLKEMYRDQTRYGIQGTEKPLGKVELERFLTEGLRKLEDGISGAWNHEQQVISTYFISKVKSFSLIETTDDSGKTVTKKNGRGLPCFKPIRFEHIHLPLFLEGPVHFLRCNTDREQSGRMIGRIRQSGLYDATLKMYKVNESLADQPMEIGRARTFSPGWFENESVWLHMAYKYMLELIRNGFYEDFFRDFKHVLVPFMKPEVYGRSILENSSFIVSSANPDPSLHGNGFVARLSGATAEFISILSIMCMGTRPFGIDEQGQLQFAPRPVLPEWLFIKVEKTVRLYMGDQWSDVTFEKDTFGFMFLGKTLVVYHNPLRKDTFDIPSVTPVACTLEDWEGNISRFGTGPVTGELASEIRNRQMKRIDVYLGNN